MKKIILFLSLLLFGIRVNAMEYYSDYSEFSEYQKDIIISDDLTSVEKEKFYQLYKENITYEYLENSIYKETGKIKKEYTNWVDDISLVAKDYEIDKCYEYSYHPIKNYSYIVFTNESDQTFKINKLEFYDTETNQVYFYHDNVILNPNDKFHLDLDKNYDLDNTKLRINIIGYNGSNHIKTKIFLAENFDIFDNGDYLTSLEGYDNVNYEINDFRYFNDIYDNTKNITGCFSNLKEKISDYKVKYRNIKNLKEYEIINKEYIDRYNKEDIDGYKIDINKYIYLYRSRKRDKVIISDDLKIDSKDKELKDFIEYSSIDINDIKINSNIDYTKNGEYDIEFILPFKKVNTKVIVDIPSNNKIEEKINDDIVKENNDIKKIDNDISNKEDYIESINNQLLDSSYLIDKKNLEIKEVILEEEKNSNKIKDELVACKNLNKKLEEQKIELKDEKEIKEQSIGYMYILFLLIIILYMIKRRLIKKNN